MSDSPWMVYLASGSPRRRELLRQIGVRFEVVVPNVVETFQPGESPRTYVARLARAKARGGAARVREQGRPPGPVLGADTEVVLDGEILGKPLNEAQGFDMLQRLSGRSHEVLTAVAVFQHDRIDEALSKSRVTFASLSPAEIKRYWTSGEPIDKAGGYAVQGQAAAFVTQVEGSYSGIVGLPLYETAQLLKRAGWEP